MLHQKLPHLDRVWINRPIFFVTIVTHRRSSFLAAAPIASILYEEWQAALARHGWSVGAYVVMPDHVHFFAQESGENSVPLRDFIKKWKEWTAKRAYRDEAVSQTRLWQPDFFDRLMRDRKECEAKRQYMYDNPLRAGLVSDLQDWPYQGELNAL